MTHEIEVWAPAATAVEIEVGPPGEAGTRHPMVARGEGWWRWEGGDAASGELDYSVRVGDDPLSLPDPRSARQPYGVHGPSRTFDTRAHAWSDAAWPGPRAGRGVLGAVIYELHVGTFTPEGTFDAALERLDHLVALGVDVVEVMPVAEFEGPHGWGYDGVALYAVHEPYGGPAAFQRFVDACHAAGLGVCLDVVLNHLGASGNYLARFGPYFTQAHLTPWGPAMNLDQEGSAPVRAFLADLVVRWFREFHVDALRLDAVHELKDAVPPHFLSELASVVGVLSVELGRPCELIAESDLNDVRMVTAVADGGLGMSAQWDDDLHHALHVALTGETQGYYADFAGCCPAAPDSGPLGVLATVLTRGFLHDGRFSSFRGRDWGRRVPVDVFDARHLVVSLQTHDQVGNRALGDRIGAGLDPGLLAFGAAVVLLGPFTPMLFMGEEWAASTPWQFFTSFQDEAMADAVRAGRRLEFGGHGWLGEVVPDPQDPLTQQVSVLNWAEAADEPHKAVLAWYTACARLRPDLVGEGTTRMTQVDPVFDESERWFAMRVHRPLGSYAVVGNLGDDPASVPLGEVTQVLVAWTPVGTEVTDGGLRLPGRSAAVVRLAAP